MDRDIQRHARAEKRIFIDKLSTEAEEEAAKQDMDTLYMITKILTGGFTSTEVPVKNLKGKIVSTDVEKS